MTATMAGPRTMLRSMRDACRQRMATDELSRARAAACGWLLDATAQGAAITDTRNAAHHRQVVERWVADLRATADRHPGVRARIVRRAGALEWALERTDPDRLCPAGHQLDDDHRFVCLDCDEEDT